jgi:hypothetical protein
MNYTRLFDQMLFINPKGDTLAMANEKPSNSLHFTRILFTTMKDI